MQKQKSEDILDPRMRINLPGDFGIGAKMQFLVKLRGHAALYNQSNLSKKYPFFFRSKMPATM